MVFVVAHDEAIGAVPITIDAPQKCDFRIVDTNEVGCWLMPHCVAAHYQCINTFELISRGFPVSMVH